MKIYCIVVYTSISAKQEFHAAQSVGWFTEEPHFKKIQDNMTFILFMLDHHYGMHTLKSLDGNYYSYYDEDKLIVAAVDEVLSPDHQRSLIEKCKLVKNSQELERLLIEPDEAIKSKIDFVKESLEETKQALREDIEKLMQRDESLSQLLVKTNELTLASFKFSKRSSELKNQTRCPTLFSLFNSVKGWFSNETYEYDYEAKAQSKM